MFIDLLKKFFFIRQDHLSKQNEQAFQQSALRIFIALSLAIFIGIEIYHTTFAIQTGEFANLAINTAFIFVLCGLLYFSQQYTKLVAKTFLAFLAFTGMFLLLSSDSFYAQKYALIALYSIPLVTRLLFSFKASMVAIIVNILPFYLVADSAYSAMPDSMSPFYFQLLTFFTLNMGLPIAVSRIILTLEDNTSHINLLYKKLYKNHALYQEFFEHTGSPSILCDHRGKVLKANKLAQKLLTNGKSKKIENTKILDWLVPIKNKNTSEKYFWQVNTTECTLKIDKNIEIEVHRATLTNHGYYVLHLQVITHLKAMQQELQSTQLTNNRLTYFDPLTKLPNHQYFCRQTNQLIRSRNEHLTGAMFIIRISQFKLLNKQYGKDNSNKIILSFAKILQKKLSQQAVIGRLRGVKFACFIPLNQTYLIQKNLSTLIQSLLPNHITINGNTLNMNYQVGIAYHQGEGNSAEEMIEQCEMALEYSTSADRFSYFNNKLETQLVEEHRLGLKLSAAIKRKEIKLWLQPQVSPNGDICSFEALARWPQKDGSFVSPFVFIRIAEELGLLPQLAENLITELVAVLESWNKDHINTPIAFNLAGQELMNDMFFALLMSLITEHPWLHKMLELEITETSAVMTHPLIHKRLRALSQYGFSIAIDDFGTGQASLGQLIDIPANILKIDRRFVSPLPEDQRHTDIVKSTIQLANSLNMKVIAEGIETREQADMLISLGCHTLQGYYFGKPSPIVEWTEEDNKKAKAHRMVY